MSPSMAKDADEQSAPASQLSASTSTPTSSPSSDASAIAASSTASSFVVAGRKHQSTPPPTPFATRFPRRHEPSTSEISSEVVAALAGAIESPKNGTTRSPATELGEMMEYGELMKQQRHDDNKVPDDARNKSSTDTKLSGYQFSGREAYNVREFIPGRLYFMWTTKKPAGNSQMTYLTVDGYIEYASFFSDFGPFDIASVFRFISLIKERLEITTSRRKALCLYTEPEDEKRANVAFAMCCYMMLVHNKTPEDAFAPVKYLHPPVKPFRDAGSGPSTYTLSILDCLRGLRKGLDMGLLRLEDFDLDEYEHYELVSNGDLSWITPSFVAFAGPTDDLTHEELVRLEKDEIMKKQEKAEAKAEEEEKAARVEGEGAGLQSVPTSMSANEDSSEPQSWSGLPTSSSSTEALAGFSTHSSSFQPFAQPPDTTLIDEGQTDNEDTVDLPQNTDKDADNTKPRTSLFKPFQSVLDHFETRRVQCVIRLNDKMYDETHFRVRGIEHFDLIYPDGHCPPKNIIERFLEISERVIMGVELQGNEGAVDENSEREGQGRLREGGRGGIVAVHCMAGLGRTGTLIAIFLMRHFDMTARETIAFLRLMRPGMVVGPQQNWLALNERYIRHGGQKWRRRLQQRKQQLHGAGSHNRLTTDNEKAFSRDSSIVYESMLSESETDDDEDSDDSDDADDDDEDVEDSDDISSISTTATDDSGDDDSIDGNTDTEGSLSAVSCSTSRSTTPPGPSRLDMGASTDNEDSTDDGDIEAPGLTTKELDDEDEMEDGLTMGIQSDKERVGDMDYVIPVQPRKQAHRSYARYPRSR